MVVRRLKESELPEIARLIRDSVHTVCRLDYTQKELDAWAPINFDLKKFAEALFKCYNIVATQNEKIVGFLSITTEGYINRLYTHKDYQNMGVASLLLKDAENWALSQGIITLSLDSSKTAEDFYIKKGFYKSGISVLNHNGVIFRNTVMKKDLRESL